MSLTKEQIAGVKGRGFLLNRGTECFSGRVVPVGGVYTADQLRAIAECAEKFGSGKVAFTSRLSPEIVGIPYENIDAACAFLAERGMYFGGTGAKVRPVTSCKGTTCVYGNIDTQAIAKELHERFYIGMGDVRLPHKFKIGVGGCPNSCMKPSLNDIGIEGRRSFEFDAEKCRGCKKCLVAAGCPSRAVTVADGKAVIDAEKCLRCGVCVGKCPFGAVPAEAESVCRIYVGGTWGKTTRNGTALSRCFAPSEVGDIVEKTLLWYRENGYAGERLGKAIDRLGISAFEEAVFGADLLERKAEILAEPIKQP
ncbi:MAG: 4Fe-4S binding protein [Clostridia bacterium]|nr:4Fe-4S binding protein [Clostridia bacterium]